MLTTIKEILELLKQEEQVKSALATTTQGGDLKTYNPYRTELFGMLFQIKKLLNLYSHNEIAIARKWRHLKPMLTKSRGNDAKQPGPAKQLQLNEDGFLRVLILLYLLSKGREVQAFLSLSLGAVALLMDDEPFTHQNKLRKF